jgi:predicted dehydrogenase
MNTDEKLKIGIVGTGSRGTYFGILINRNPQAELVALCDPNTVRMEAVAEKLGKKYNTYTDIEKMADKELLDAVIITSPDYCHVPNVKSALAKGLNVLIDKPLATTTAGCKEIIKAAEKSGKTVMMGFNLRHDPTLKRLKQIVDDGILGNVFLIENREFYDGGKTYMARWNRKYELSGGLWVHKGSHDFDVFNWLLGFPKPFKVAATAGVNVFRNDKLPFKIEQGKEPGPTCSKCLYSDICPDCYSDAAKSPEWNDDAIKFDNYAKDLCMYLSDKDTHDNGIAMVEYENGARASHMECFVTSITSDRLYTVIGDKGQAEVSLHDKTIKIRPRWSKEIITYNIPQTEGGHGGADPKLVESFLNVISGNAPNASTIEQGMIATAVGEAAEISRRENKMVFVKDLLSV